MNAPTKLPAGAIEWASGGPSPVVPDDLRVGQLLERAGQHGATITFVEGAREKQVSCDALARRARRRAAALLDRGIGPGARVGLLLPTSPEFIESFFGVLLAGAAAIVLPPPLPFGRTASAARQLGRISRRAELAASIVAPHLLDLAAESKIARAWRADQLDAPELSRLETPEVDSPAVIQFTSGSTSAPRGAVLTHAAVLAQVAAVHNASRVGPGEVFCSWLPLYHDLGLIGALLSTLYGGASLVLQRIEEFLSRPLSWLTSISQHGAAHSAAPNFAYALVAERLLREKSPLDLDLSRWRVAFNGGEPVDPRTMAAFAAAAAQYGFQESALWPSYGLAEATLAVSTPRVGSRPHHLVVDADALADRARVQVVAEDSAHAKRLVSTGSPVAGTTVAIVAREGDVSGATVGEVFVSSPTLMRGYLHDAVETARVLDEGWLATGDLGFLHEGELFVTGRIKDVIIVRGRNFYPQDVEALVNELPEVRKGTTVAAGGAGSGGEELAVFAETKLTATDALTALAARIETVVRMEIGVQPTLVALLSPGSLPKTSSGKLQRQRTLALSHAGKLPTLHLRRAMRKAA